MAVRRNDWQTAFTVWPRFPCPTCRVGILRINKASIVEQETRDSKREHQLEEWEPDWIEGRFIGQLICQNPACKDHAFVCGRTGLSLEMVFDANGNPDQDYVKRYEPKYFEPALPVFPIVKECPAEVTEQLENAFSLMWLDHGSCANSMRIALEKMMDERGVKRKARIRNGPNQGKFRTLSLHERIEVYGEKEKQAQEQLMALKWLGNIGSHTGHEDLKRNHLIDAFEHFEFALELIYVQRAVALSSRAKAIIKAKGLPKT